MKQRFFLPYLLFSVLTFTLFTSCVKEDSKEIVSSAIDLNKIKSVIAMNGESQIIAYNMLTAADKFYIWNTKLEILQRTGELNAKQQHFVRELQETLRVDFFEKERSRTAKEYYNSYLPQMKRIGLSLFTPSEMVANFASINSKIIVAGPPVIHCGCNTSDSWCVTGDCYSFYCSSADSGCGWWMGEICNGFCARK